MAGYAFGEVTRLVYEAIWNEYCDWGLEFAKVRLADERARPERARGDVVDAGRGPRHVPAAAPSGHAVRHRGALGGAAAPGDGPRPAHRRPLARGGGARPARRARGRRAHRPRRRDPQRPRVGEAPGRRLARDAGLRADRARADLRGAPPGHRATRPRAAAPSRADPRGARGGRPRRATSRSSSPVARSRRPSGPRRPTPTPMRSNATDSSATWPKPRAGWRPPASDSPTRRSSSRAPAAVVEGARAREAELADQVARLRERTRR